MEDPVARSDHFPRRIDQVSASRMTRRAVLHRAGLGGLVIATAGTAACGGDSGQQGSTGASRFKPGGTLHVGAEADAYQVRGGGGGQVGQYPLNANIFESLVRMDADYGLVPALATKWELRGENTWRFTLRKGVRFHDGTRFDARAVKYTFDRIAADGGGTPGLEKGGTKIVDDHTIDVTPGRENRRLPSQIVHPEYSILAPGSDPADKPIGTGPFRFGSYQREEQITVQRFDDYWGGATRLDAVTFHFLPDPNSRRLALESGDVQLVLDVPREAVSELRSKGFAIPTSSVGAMEAFYQNISGDNGYTILTDSTVRKAIARSIDRTALVDGLYEGLAVNEQTFIPARLLGEYADLVEGHPYDPDGARRLLDEAGWTAGAGGTRSKDGTPLKLELINGFPSADAHGDVPTFLQSQLAKVGVEMEIVTMPDTASYTDRVSAKKGDLWLEQGSQNDANPAFLPALLFWQEGYFGQNPYQPLFAPTGEFNDLIEQALAAPETDRCKELTAQAMHVLIDELAIPVPLAGITNVQAADSSLANYQPQPSQLQTRFDAVAFRA